MGVPPGGPVPGGGRGGVRGPLPAAGTPPRAIGPQTADLIVALRKELTGQGLDAGPDTIAWQMEHHHQVKVSPATISRYLARAGLVTPEPAKRPQIVYLEPDHPDRPPGRP